MKENGGQAGWTPTAVKPPPRNKRQLYKAGGAGGLLSITPHTSFCWPWPLRDRALLLWDCDSQHSPHCCIGWAHHDNPFHGADHTTIPTVCQDGGRHSFCTQDGGNRMATGGKREAVPSLWGVASPSGAPSLGCGFTPTQPPGDVPASPTQPSWASQGSASSGIPGDEASGKNSTPVSRTLSLLESEFYILKRDSKNISSENQSHCPPSEQHHSTAGKTCHYSKQGEGCMDIQRDACGHAAL